MNFVPVISVNYSKYKDLPFLNLANTIYTGLHNNAHYPSPQPKLEDYLVLITDFQEAVQQQQTGLKSAKYERNRTRKLLAVATEGLSGYATETTPGRPDLWAAAGFPLTKETSSPRPAAQPAANLKLMDGDAAQTLVASVDRQAGVYAYLWRVRPKNGPTGRFCYDTLVTRIPSVVIEGLDSETAYCVQCAVWNDTGALVWCDALSRIVQ